MGLTSNGSPACSPQSDIWRGAGLGLRRLDVSLAPPCDPQHRTPPFSAVSSSAVELGCPPPAAGSADNEMSHLHSSAGPGGPGPGWRDMASQDRRQVWLFLADPGTDIPVGSGTLTPRLVEHNGTSRFIWFNLHIGEMRKLKSTEGTTITELTAAKLEREARPLNPRPVRFPWGQQHSNSFCGILSQQNLPLCQTEGEQSFLVEAGKRQA